MNIFEQVKGYVTAGQAAEQYGIKINRNKMACCPFHNDRHPSMKVAIIMGSNSDWPILEPAEKTLKEFGVEVEVIVASAHRTPDVVHEFAAGARNRGVEAIIAAAGAAAHLGGVIAAYTTVPVIGIPINATPLNGMDALLSFVQMPAGIPVATMAINGAKNAALFAVQILSVKYPELVTKLAENRLQMQEEVKAKGEKLAKMRAEGK